MQQIILRVQKINRFGLDNTFILTDLSIETRHMLIYNLRHKRMKTLDLILYLIIILFSKHEIMDLAHNT